MTSLHFQASADEVPTNLAILSLSSLFNDLTDPTSQSCVLKIFEGAFDRRFDLPQPFATKQHNTALRSAKTRAVSATMLSRPWPLVVALLSSFHLSSCLHIPPNAANEFLRCHYDYVVVGGGASGLVVANRLSEDPNGASGPLPSLVCWRLADSSFPQ